jgi:hypothetical protein
MSTKLITEAVVVGIVTVIVGYFVDILFKIIEKESSGRFTHPEHYVRLFFIGVLAHFGFEFLGFNKWYCTHGNACVI